MRCMTNFTGPGPAPRGPWTCNAFFEHGLRPAGEFGRGGGASGLVQRVNHSRRISSGLGTFEQSAGHGQDGGAGFLAGGRIVQRGQDQRERLGRGDAGQAAQQELAFLRAVDQGRCLAAHSEALRRGQLLAPGEVDVAVKAEQLVGGVGQGLG